MAGFGLELFGESGNKTFTANSRLLHFHTKFTVNIRANSQVTVSVPGATPGFTEVFFIGGDNGASCTVLENAVRVNSSGVPLYMNVIVFKR